MADGGQRRVAVAESSTPRPTCLRRGVEDSATATRADQKQAFQAIPYPLSSAIRHQQSNIPQPAQTSDLAADRPDGVLALYQEHFGLRALPFGETVDPAATVSLPSREAARRRLRYGLEQGRGPALLFGPSGSGKTVVAAELARGLGGRSVHLTYPAMPAPEFLAFLADELDGLQHATAGPPPGLHATLRRLRARLAGPAIRGRPTLLIVDEAHLIDDPATFESLRLLTNFASAGPPDLMLLLVGQPGGPARPAAVAGRSADGPLRARAAGRGRVVGLRPRPARRGRRPCSAVRPRGSWPPSIDTPTASPAA